MMFDIVFFKRKENCTKLLLKPTAILIAFVVNIVFLSQAQQATAKKRVTKLSLSQSIELALQQNPNIEIQKVEILIQKAGIDSVSGTIMPVLSSSVSYFESKEASLFTYGDTDGLYDRDFLRIETSLEGLLPLLPGTRYQLSVGSDIARTNNQVATLSPSFMNRLELNLVQPLLKGFGRYALDTKIEAKRLDHQISLDSLQLEIGKVLYEVAAGYWSLVAMQKQEKNARKAYSLAQKQLRLSKQRVRAGTLPEMELAEARAKEALAKLQIEDALSQKEKAQIDFLLLIVGKNSKDLEKYRYSEVLLVDDFNMQAKPKDLDQLIENALTHRPELKILQRRMEAAHLNTEMAENDALPRLDLSGQMGFVGYSGDEICNPDNEQNCPEINPALVGPFGSSWERIITGDMPHWQVGLEFELPLSSDQRNYQAEVNELKEKQLQSELEEMKAKIRIEVLDAWRNATRNEKRVQIASKRRDLAEENLVATQQKFRAGLCTNSEVFRTQSELSEAERDLVFILLEQMISQTKLESVTGNLPAFFEVDLK